MALFPNFAERLPAERYPGTILLNAWEPRYRTGRQNPSGRVMPAQYFMYLEMPHATLKSELPRRVFFRNAIHAPEKDGGVLFQDAVGVAIGFR